MAKRAVPKKGRNVPRVGRAYRIGWFDHYLLPGTWTDMDRDPTEEKARCYSYGIVIKEESLYYTVAGSCAAMVNGNDEVFKVDYGDVNRILKSAIFEVKEIK